MNPHKIILTFDLEFWYNSQFLRRYLPKEKENFQDFVLESTLPLLDSLKKYNIKATFFILGELARKYPGVIKKIYKGGHEIGCHSYSHQILSDLGPIEFEKEIKLSVGLLQQITGKKPIGFRAPTFSLNNKTKWALEILAKYGFKYDSSIFPLSTPFYGSSEAPLGIYRISKENILEADENSKIFEFPLAVWRRGKIKIPIAGGFYFRLLPLFLYKSFLKSILKERIPVLYFHPHELYNFIPNLRLPFWKKKLKYWGVNKNFLKIEKLLKNFQFDSIENILKEF